MNGRFGRARAASVSAMLIWGVIAAAPAGVAATSLCVGGAGCYASVQEAVDAAHDGDTIHIHPGTYAGGITVNVSVTLAGAGASVTRIQGGGPVITIGVFDAKKEPTVTIDGLTIRDGLTRTSPQSMRAFGIDGVVALGGGVEIPRSGVGSLLGATVTIRNSVITHNRVATTATVPSGLPCGCPFAGARGGGIDSWGTLTLINTTVSHNLVGAATGLDDDVSSDAEGGGILSSVGTVTIRHSAIHDNAVAAAAPNGRFADGGGMFLESGTLVMDDSAVSGNSATLSAAWPDDVDMLAIAGGVHLADSVKSGRITGSTISDNSVSMTNSVGYANAFSGAIHVDWGVNNFELADSVVSGNSVTSHALAGGDAFGDSAVGEVHGTISGSRFAGNSVDVRSAGGNAFGIAGASIFTGTISNSLFRGNQLMASAPTGLAFAGGGALLADYGGMTLRETTIKDNTAGAYAADAYAQGGGIYDAPIPDGPPGGRLTLWDSTITGNAVTGSAGATLQGGGIYLADETYKATNTDVTGNSPDQCFGC